MRCCPPRWERRWSSTRRRRRRGATWTGCLPTGRRPPRPSGLRPRPRLRVEDAACHRVGRGGSRRRRIRYLHGSARCSARVRRRARVCGVPDPGSVTRSVTPRERGRHLPRTRRIRGYRVAAILRSLQTTANAAHVLGLSGEVSRLAPGHRADVLVLDDPDWRYMAYHLGGDRFAACVKSGKQLPGV